MTSAGSLSTNRRMQFIIAVLMLFLSALQPAQTNAAGPSIVAVGPTLKVRPTETVSGTASVQLLATRNEFESFQLVVHAGDQQLPGVRIELATPLRSAWGSIPMTNVVIYREEYYNVQTPSDLEGQTGRWPDALIPAVDPFYGETRNAFPVTIPAGENRVAWIDIHVPANATPGLYQGALRVTSSSGLNVQVPITLEVVNLTLPSTSSLSSIFTLTASAPCVAHYGVNCDMISSPTALEQGWRLNALYARAALDNRITVTTPHFYPLRDATQVGYFRTYVLPLLNGTANTRLKGAKLTTLRVDGNLAYLPTWKQEAEAGGFVGRAFVYACDEPNQNGPKWQNECKVRAAQARQVWSNVPILVTTPIQYATQFTATSHIDWIVPLINHMHDKEGAFAGNQRSAYDAFLQSDSNNRVWMYNSCMSVGCDTVTPRCSATGQASDHAYWNGWAGYAIDAPASQARAMGWLNFVYNTSGELFWDVGACLPSAWTSNFNYGGNGDGTLFYPGKKDIIGGNTDIPIESMRLKLIRDGYEDYELLKLTEQRKGRAVALQVAQQLFPSTYQATQTDSAVQQARQQLVRALDAAPSVGFIPNYGQPTCDDVIFIVDASDDLRLTQVDVTLDGQPLASYNLNQSTSPAMGDPTYMRAVEVRSIYSVGLGQHTYVARATDRSGNVTTSSGQFTLWEEYYRHPDGSGSFRCGVR